MKRINPLTGDVFKCGDKREDGRLFWAYETHRKKKDGFYVEQWLTEESHKLKKEKNKSNRYPKYQREWHLQKTYKITNEKYQELLKEQNNKCAICGTCSPGGNRVNFSIDHCHKTGTLRGLLCIACNSLLGNAKDNQDVLEKAISYLDKHTNQKG